jgi:hypothetical protein
VDLDVLLVALEVRVVALRECLVGSGFRAPAWQGDAPSTHHNFKGTGERHFPGGASINLSLHALGIVPADRAVRIEVPEGRQLTAPSKRWRAYEAASHIDDESGRTRRPRAMSSALLKQVIITLYGALDELADRSPVTVLRGLRMRQAAVKATNHSLDRIHLQTRDMSVAAVSCASSGKAYGGNPTDNQPGSSLERVCATTGAPSRRGIVQFSPKETLYQIARERINQLSR